MAVAFSTEFPAAAATLSPNEVDASSRLADLVDVNLRRKLITARRSSATSYVATLTFGSDQRINFVSVIGSSESGAATVTLLGSSGNTAINAGDLSLPLADGVGHKIFGATHEGVRRVRVSFPQVSAGGRLSCALVLAGELLTPQALPQSVRTLFGRLRFERRPRGIQVPSASRGLARTVNVNWVNLDSFARDELRDLFRASNDHSSIVFYDDSVSDGLVYGFIDGTFQVTDRQFGDYAEARLRIQEVVPEV